MSREAAAKNLLIMLESFRRDLSPPQRHPPPPDTGSAAALPPSVAGSPLGRTEPPVIHPVETAEFPC